MCTNSLYEFFFFFFFFLQATLLAINVQGRVDITRTFDGQELNTEYLFGLFANLALKTNNTNEFSPLGTPQSYEISMYGTSFMGWFQWALELLLATAQQQLSIAQGKEVSQEETELCA